MLQASDHGRRDVGGMDPRQEQAAREHAATREHRRRRDEGGGVKGMSGLPNLGNTCYLNAALQALVHTKPFADFFTECPEFLPPHIDGNSHQRSAQRRLLHSLSDVIHQVWQTGSKTASPHNFVRDVLDLNPDYRGLGQQDSQVLAHVHVFLLPCQAQDADCMPQGWHRAHACGLGPCLGDD